MPRHCQIRNPEPTRAQSRFPGEDYPTTALTPQGFRAFECPTPYVVQTFRRRVQEAGKLYGLPWLRSHRSDLPLTQPSFQPAAIRRVWGSRAGKSRICEFVVRVRKAAGDKKLRRWSTASHCGKEC